MVPSIFQNLIIKATAPRFTVDATILVSNKCPIVDEQVEAFFVMEKFVVTTV